MCGESQTQTMCKYWETVVLTLKPKVTYGNKSMINEYKVVAPEWHWCWVAFLTVWSSVWLWMGLRCLIICLKNRRQSYRKSNESEIFRSLSSFITAAKRFGVKCLELDLFLVLYIMSIFSLSLKQYWILSVFFCYVQCWTDAVRFYH